MKKRRIAIAGVLILVAIVIVVALKQQSPIYEGHNVSYWLRALDHRSTPDNIKTAKANEAFAAMGKEAVPIIFQEFQKAHSPLTKHYSNVWVRLPKNLSKFLREPSGVGEDQVLHALRAVGPSGIPVLIKELENDDFHIAHPALQALSLFQLEGNNVSEALPALIKFLDDSNHIYLRYSAAKILSRMKPPPEIAVSNLVEILGDNSLKTSSDWIVAFYLYSEAAETLGKIGIASNEVLAALNNIPSYSETNNSEKTLSLSVAIAKWRLTKENTATTVQEIIRLWPSVGFRSKEETVEVLGEIGTDAKEAEELLIAQFYENPERLAPAAIQEWRSKIRRALTKIDPDNFPETRAISAE